MGDTRTGEDFPEVFNREYTKPHEILTVPKCIAVSKEQ